MNGQEQIRHSVLAMPSKASPLVKQLVPRIMRASCEGIGSGDDSEYEDRAFSAFLVCISHLANMKDAKKRDGIIADLSGYADAVVAQSVESMDQIAEMVSMWRKQWRPPLRPGSARWCRMTNRRRTETRDWPEENTK